MRWLVDLRELFFPDDEHPVDKFKRLLVEATPRYTVRPGCEGRPDRMEVVLPVVRERSLRQHTYDAWMTTMQPDATVQGVTPTPLYPKELVEHEARASTTHATVTSHGPNVVVFAKGPKHETPAADASHRQRQRRTVVPRHKPPLARGTGT